MQISFAISNLTRWDWKKNSSWNLLETERGKRINKLITRKTDFNALETRTKLFFNEHI